MAVQQRRVSKTRKRKRKAAFKYVTNPIAKCKNCGTPHISHHLCQECNHYGGQLLTSKWDASKTKKNTNNDHKKDDVSLTIEPNITDKI
jgi:large subunit ribosomal protein L32